MKKIVLKKVSIKGFEGYEGKFEFELNENVNIFVGGNGLGKSTIADAIAWTFTGKLFEGNKNEKIVINNSSKKASVEIEFEDENGIHVLSRSATLSSSPVIKLDNKKISQKKLKELLDEDTFLMTFNPLNFLAKKPTESRNLILDLNKNCTIFKEEVLDILGDEEKHLLNGIDYESNEDLNELKNSIKEAEKKLLINKGFLEKYLTEKENIKVEENSELLKLVEDKKIELDLAKKELESFVSSQSIESIKKEYLELNNKQKELSEKILILSNDDNEEIAKQLKNLEKEKEQLVIKQISIKEKEYTIKNCIEIEKEIINKKNEICNLEKENELYRNEIRKIRAKYNLKIGSVCPVCHSVINKNNIDILQNVAKKESEDYICKGVNNKDKIESLRKELEEINKNLIKLEKEEKNRMVKFEEDKKKLIADLENEIKKIEEKIEALNRKNNEHKEAQKQKIDKVKEKMLSIHNKIAEKEEQINKKECERKEYEEKVRMIEEFLKDKENEISRNNLKRNKINEIEKSIEKSKNEIKSLEENLSLFNRTKQVVIKCREESVKLIGLKLSKHLKDVKIEIERVDKETAEIKSCFNIFYKGKILEQCSLSERIKVGIEISKMLRSSLGVEYPIFIDNSESIISFDSQGIQTIRTIVADINTVKKISEDKLKLMMEESAKVIEN